MNFKFATKLVFTNIFGFSKKKNFCDVILPLSRRNEKKNLFYFFFWLLIFNKKEEQQKKKKNDNCTILKTLHKIEKLHALTIFFPLYTHEHKRFISDAVCVVLQHGYRSRFSLSRADTAELQIFHSRFAGPHVLDTIYNASSTYDF